MWCLCSCLLAEGRSKTFCSKRDLLITCFNWFLSVLYAFDIVPAPSLCLHTLFRVAFWLSQFYRWHYSNSDSFQKTDFLFFTSCLSDHFQHFVHLQLNSLAWWSKQMHSIPDNVWSDLYFFILIYLHFCWRWYLCFPIFWAGERIEEIAVDGQYTGCKKNYKNILIDVLHKTTVWWYPFLN